MTIKDYTAQAQSLRMLVDNYEQVQRMRVALGNQLYAVDSGSDEGEKLSLIKGSTALNLYNRLRDSEDELRKDMDAALRDHPAWEWLSTVRGIGPTLATKLLGLIGNISNYDTVSKLWRLAGLAVIDGKAERLQRGVKASFNPRLKTACFLVSESFIKTGSPYRKVYDEQKARYTATKPDWTPMHCHRAAQRKMVKLFLSHLWESWRIAVGSPVRPPYAMEYLGHTSYEGPSAYSTKPRKVKKAAKP